MKEDIKSLWSEVISHMEGMMSRPSFDSFLRDSEALAALGHHLVVKVANTWAKNTVKDVYKNQIENLLLDISGKRWEVEFVESADEVAGLQEEKSPVAKVNDAFSKRMGLLEGNTFDTFVVGKSNQFAQSVSIAIAEKMAHDLSCKKE